MPSDALYEVLRQEWRELGFFYDVDDQARVWKLVGCRAGLLRFRDLLRSYAADPRNELKSEHWHYGPYGYLEVMTWPEARFDDHAIRGSLADIARLATNHREQPCFGARRFNHSHQRGVRRRQSERADSGGQGRRV